MHQPRLDTPILHQEQMEANFCNIQSLIYQAALLILTLENIHQIAEILLHLSDVPISEFQLLHQSNLKQVLLNLLGI